MTEVEQKKENEEDKKEREANISPTLFDPSPENSQTQNLEQNVGKRN